MKDLHFFPESVAKKASLLLEFLSTDLRHRQRTILCVIACAILLLTVNTPTLYAQNGSAGNPFTNVAQATTAPNGQYHFNLNGQTFQTYVENGKVLVLCDPGPSATNGQLAELTTLTTLTRGVLPRTALEEIKNIVKVHISSSGGSLNLTTSNSVICDKVRYSSPIHAGLSDNNVNNDWTGTGAAQITADATINSPYPFHLNTNIVDINGNSSAMEWIPTIASRKVDKSQGNSSESFYLWITAADSPGGVKGATLWLKSDAGTTPASGTLTVWQDQSTNHTTTVVGNPQVNTNVVNYHPSVAFDGTDDAIETPHSALLNAPAFTINTTIKVTGGTGYRAIISSKNASFQGYALYLNNANLEFWVGQGGSSWSIMNGGVIPTNEWLQVTAKFDGTNGFLYVNGKQVATSAATYQPQTSFKTRIGMGQGNSDEEAFPFIGEIPEVIYYPKSIDDAEKQQIESYLAIKYGITLDQSISFYVNSEGTGIWDNATYWHDVFGIGRDDAGTLNKISSNSMNSGSGDGTGQSGKGNLVLSNAASLDNNDFLIIGHNNAALTEQTSDLPAALNGGKRLAREWKVSRTNDVGTVTLKFSTLGLTLSGTTAADFKLLIDENGDGNFTNSFVSQVVPATYASNILTFNLVNIPHDAVFTLLTQMPQVGPGVLGASLWLKANAGATNSGSNLTGWTDQTGTNTFSVVGTPGYKPNAINFNQAVTFNNTDPVASLPSNRLNGSADITYVDGFAVYKHTDNNSNFLGSTSPGGAYGKAIFAIAGVNTSWVGNGEFLTYSSFTAPGLSNAFNLVNMDVSLTASPFATGRYNGANQSVTAGSGVDFANLVFTPMIGGTNNSGSDPADGWAHAKAEVAEIVLYPSSLSAADKLKVESYLALKYGISLDPSVGNYISSAGTVIWNNTTYRNDVFGIGKDDVSGLNQPQSNSVNTGSGDGTGQSGKGNIVLNSQFSPLTNNQFVLMGHNNGALTETTTGLPTNLSNYKRLVRQWWVKNTGNVSAVELTFDFNGLTVTGTNKSQFKLLVDGDSDGDLSTGTPIIYGADEFAGNKIRFININLPDQRAVAVITSSPTPGGVPDSKLWLNAGAGATELGGSLLTWSDQTGNNSMTLIGNLPYTADVINFNPAVQFNGNSSSNTVPDDRLLGDRPIQVAQAIGVFKYNTGGTLLGQYENPSSPATTGIGIFHNNGSADVKWSDGNGNGGQYPNSNYNSQFSINTIDFGKSVSPFADAWLNSSTTTVTTAGSDFSALQFIPLIGGTNNSATPTGDKTMFNGVLAELICFGTSLPEASRKNVESYLALKYGITLSPTVTNYVNSAGTVLWNNTAYWNDVFGIGKDDNSGLNQPQSNSMNTGSGNGTGQSGKGNIVMSSPSSLDNNDFLIIGHDNGALTEQTTELPSALANSVRLAREWKVKRTGDPGTINLKFDVNGLNVTGVANTSFKLIIDTDGNGDFSNGTIQEVNAASVSSGLVTFSNVNLTDGTVFTFATGLRGPAGLAGTTLWLKADDGVTVSGNNVTGWTDKMGNNTFTISGSPQSGVDKINFNNAVNFNGTTDFLTGNAAIPFRTLYAVVKRDNTNFASTVMSASTNTSVNAGYFIKGDRLATGNNQVAPSLRLAFESTGTLGTEKARLALSEIVPGQGATGSKTFIDGKFFATQSFTGSGTQMVTFSDVPHIGRSQNNASIDYFDGQIAELAMFSTAPTDEERRKVQSYLAIKYGISLNSELVNYISSSGTVLWNNVPYWNDVFGIGRDALSQLNQASSNSINTGSGNGTGVSGKGNILISTPSSLDDGDFLLIGNNAGSFANQTTDLPSPGLVRAAREWKVKRTGDPGTVRLEFTLDGLNFIDVPTVANYALLVDTDGNGDFTNGTVTQLNPTSKSGDVLRFDALNLPDGAVFTFAYLANPTWTLSASSSTANYNAVGNTINYNLSLANTGNISISTVSVTASVAITGLTLTGGDGNGNQILDPSETWTYTASRSVTQGDLDNGTITNTFTAAGTAAAGTLANATDNVVVNAIQSASWTLVKTSTTPNYNNVGDVLNFSLVLTNTGNVSINTVTLTDNKVTTGPTRISGDTGSDNIMNPGEAWKYSASYSIVQADLDGGSVTNTATASGTPAGGTLNDVSDNVTVNAIQVPAWVIVKKSQTPLYSKAGDIINYTILLTNTGNETITGVTVSDPLATTGPTRTSGDLDSDNQLDVSETWTYTANYQVTQTDVDAGNFTNTVTATATAPVGLAPATASETVNAIQDPAWTLISTVSNTTYQLVGEQLTYSISLTNTGNEPISNIIVTDPQASSGPTYVSGDIGNDQVLGVGEFWRYTSVHSVSQNDLDDGAFTSTTTASGTPNAGTLNNASGAATATAVQLPSWLMTLASPIPTYSQPGDVISYIISLTNNGNVSINPVTTTLAKFTSAPVLQSGDDGDNKLEPGETWVYQASYSVTQNDLNAGSVVNTATATGTPAGGNLNDATASKTTVSTPLPAWTLTKSAATPGYNSVGDAVDFSISLANTGNVPISAITVSDPRASSGPTLVSGDTGNDNILGVGETWTYTSTTIIIQADLDAGELVSTASASGSPTQGTLAVISDVTAVPALIFPDWVIVKTPTTTSFDSPSDPINYLILVTNTGNTSISNVVVTDPTASASPTYSSGDINSNNILDVGETWTYTSSYITSQADVDAGRAITTASATGTPAQGSLHVVTAPASVNAIQNPAWTLGRTVTPITYSTPGATIQYQTTITNTGNVSLTNVVVTESKATTLATLQSGDSDGDLVLDVGESWIYSANYLTTQADIDAGSFTTVVNASATPAGGSLGTLSNSQNVTAVQTPNWTIQKITTSPTYVLPGNIITYQVRIRNTGNVTIDNVLLTESKTTTPNVLQSGDADADNKLDVNEEWVFQSTYTIDINDIVTGSVASTTTVSGTPSGGTLANLTASATATAVQSASWTITKVSDKTQYGNLAEVITYTIELTNTGNIPISVTSVTDNNVSTPLTYVSGDSNSDSKLSLAEKWVYTGTYSVSQQDLIEGTISGTTTAVGTPDAGTLESISASLTIQAEWKSGGSASDIDPSEGFSPNGDGINDFWWIKNIEGFPSNQVYIYNAAGSLVFKLSGYNNADQRFEGIANLSTVGSSTLNPGTYYYVIAIEGRQKLTGYITLLK